MIDKLLVDSGVLLSSLDFIVFDQGPGNFIGVRIGISLAKGLSLGSDIPLIGVSSLNVLAQGAWRKFSAKRVITIIDACMNEFYWARYSLVINDNSSFSWTCQPNKGLLVTIRTAKELIYGLQGTWVLVGTGWNNNDKLNLYIDNSNAILLKERMLPEARDMFPLSIPSWKNKLFFQADDINPIYLKSPVLLKEKF